MSRKQRLERVKESSALVMVFSLIFCASQAGAGTYSGGTGEPNDPYKISTALFRKLPIGWKVEKSFIASQDQTKGIGQKLGAQIKKVSNTILSAHGNRIQANIIEAASQEDADKIYQAVLDAHYGDEQCVFQDETRVLEFTCGNINLVTKAGWELGLRPKPKRVKYRITFDAAPIKTGDFMSWNRLFNLFWAYDESHNKEAEKQIRALSRRFQFANKIELRACGIGDARPTYSFKPVATGLKKSPHLDTRLYVFENLSRKVGVPFVFMEANVATYEGGFTPSVRKATEDLLVPTEFWPVDDTEIKALATKIITGCNNDQERVKAILVWLTPGKNIKFGGPVTGSRYGVKKVLEQGFGQCWDFSDCFVTLCRSAGIPCRQVAGWLYAASGHIWAEVLYEGKGWQQVDPTGAGVLECGIYHIPYLTSEDGSMPILYVSMPEIKLLEP